MITAAQRVHFRRIYRRLCLRIRATGIKGVKLRTVRFLVVYGHQFQFKPSHWRVLGSVISRNPAILGLSPKLVAFRIIHNPDALETPEAQATKEALRARAYKAPIGQKCPSCGDMTLFVTFPMRSTGPGSKAETTRMARCSHCGLLD